MSVLPFFTTGISTIPSIPINLSSSVQSGTWFPDYTKLHNKLIHEIVSICNFVDSLSPSKKTHLHDMQDNPDYW